MKPFDCLAVEKLIVQALEQDDPQILADQAKKIMEAVESKQLPEIIGGVLIDAVESIESLLWFKQSPD